MKSIIIIMINIYAFLVIVSLLIIHISSIHSSSSRLEDLSIRECNNRLCYFEIGLGQTDWDTAQRLLNANPNLSPGSLLDPQYYFYHDAPIRVQISTSDGIVRQIDVDLYGEILSVIDVLTAMGQPCAAVPDSYSLNLWYPNALFVIQKNNPEPIIQINPNTFVRLISIGYRSGGCDDLPETYTEYTWHGFGRYSP